jgi:ectoine hydroxylase-related dioxygenase (phytanoyl-CoA dioxygenase family)
MNAKLKDVRELTSSSKKKIGDIHKNTGYNVGDDANAVFDSLVSRGLTQNALELEVKGLTVIPPEKVAPAAFVNRTRNAMLKAYQRRHGVDLDWVNAKTLKAALGSPVGAHMAYMLLEDPVFSELMLNETLLAMVTYRIGRNATISSYQALVKANGGEPLPLHTDELMMPPPYATHGGGINVTYTLTDYTIKNGALLYVPGSYKYKRLPVGNEGWDLAVPVEAPAGSLIIWDGATWHGALPRKAKGLRLNVVMYFIRPHLRPMEVFFDRIDEATMRQYPPRYRTLLGENLKWWWHEEGPSFDAPDYARIGTSAYC